MTDAKSTRAPLRRAEVSVRNRVGRVIWFWVWLILYRPSPAPLHAWRRFLLRMFGATVEKHAHPYPGARIFAPWNLTMREASCLANGVDCYCVAPVELGPYSTVSQNSYLCTASHDFRDPAMPLVIAPIVIGADAWVAADAFVGPGVTVGEGAVVSARTSVVRDVEPWTVVAAAALRVVGSRAVVRRPRQP